MLKYELKKHTANLKDKGTETLYQGCAVDADQEPQVIALYDNLDDALAELSKYSTYVKHYDSSFLPYPWAYYEVEEYAVEVGEYDEDGEFLSGSDFYITEMPEA